MGTNNNKMDAMQQDIFREIANIGAGHASSALSMMLECPVEQDIPEVQLVPLGDMMDLLGGAERVVVGVAMQVSGDMSGYLLAIMDAPEAQHVIEVMRGQPLEKPPEGAMFSEMDESALKEAVNIMGGSYLTAICQMTGLEMFLTSPYASMDMLGAILSIALVQAGQSGDYVLYIKSGLFGAAKQFAGDLLLIPSEESSRTMLQSLGCM